MTKIDELIKKIKDLKAANIQRAKDAEATKASVEKLRQAEQAAAASGDLEAYKEAKAKRIAAEDEAFVLGESSKRISDKLDPAEVKAAWKDYCSGYNKDFAKDLKKYQEARSALAGLYYEMIRKQNKALAVRRECAEMLDCKCDVFGQPIIPGELSDLQLLPSVGENSAVSFRGASWPADAMLFVISKEIGFDNSQAIYDIVKNKVSNDTIAIG